MATLIIVLGGVLAGSLLFALWCRWLSIEREYQRDVGWHRMWTERIMEDEL